MTPDKTVKPSASDVKMPKADPRAAVEWVLSLGGTVSYRGKTSANIFAIKDIPDDGSVLVAVDLTKAKLKAEVTDADIMKLAGLNSLEGLTLRDLTLSDEGMRPLQTLTGLTSLTLTGVPVTDAVLPFIKPLKQLKVLEIANTRSFKGHTFDQLADLPIFSLRLSSSGVDDESLPGIMKIKSVGSLNLRETAVSDDGMPSLKKSSLLRTLSLGGSAVTSNGLAALKGSSIKELNWGKNADALRAALDEVAKSFPKLQLIWLPTEGVYSADDMKKLGKVFPELKAIECNGGTMPDDACEALTEIKTLDQIRLLSRAITARTVAALIQVKNLSVLNLNDGKMDDELLAQLTAIKTLKELSLSKVTGITDAGIAAFKKARQDVKVAR
ncbi:MAG: hypothetical protein ACKVY0_30585 [Prosthecobacter sp.]|uniref:hypothetical protein n=1 Tax=Prosthecobacter sp. TaxID=1965333 RepID=UPI0038FDED62